MICFYFISDATPSYRNDFGDIRECIHFCLQYLNENDRSVLMELLEQTPNLLKIKFGDSHNKFYASLKETK